MVNVAEMAEIAPPQLLLVTVALAEPPERPAPEGSLVRVESEDLQEMRERMAMALQVEMAVRASLDH